MRSGESYPDEDHSEHNNTSIGGASGKQTYPPSLGYHSSTSSTDPSSQLVTDSGCMHLVSKFAQDKHDTTLRKEDLRLLFHRIALSYPDDQFDPNFAPTFLDVLQRSKVGVTVEQECAIYAFCQQVMTTTRTNRSNVIYTAMNEIESHGSDRAGSTSGQTIVALAAPRPERYTTNLDSTVKGTLRSIKIPTYEETSNLFLVWEMFMEDVN